VSSSTAVEILRRARQREVNVTAEATPHHLALTDADVGTYDTHFKMNPPLRSEGDRRALIEGLRDGTIDCIATDHAPHTNYEKDKEFDYAPFGIIGLETALGVAIEVLHRQERFTLPEIVDLMTRRPARILKLPAGTLAEGAIADITVFDPEEKWTVNGSKFFSKSANSPWIGRQLHGRVKYTVVSGRLVYEIDRIVL
jgi:dihydroorotase